MIAKAPSSIPALTLAILCQCLVVASGAVQTLHLSVTEEQPARTLVGDLKELNKRNSSHGAGEKPQLHFKHPHKSPYNLFSIVQSTGHLVTTRAINREHVCSREAAVSAARNPLLDEPCVLSLDVHLRQPNQPNQPNQPRPDSTLLARLKVEIVDVNDHQPVFYQPVHSLEVSESAAVGSLFKLPLAVDFDSGENSVQDYRFGHDEGAADSGDESVFPFSLVYDESRDSDEMELNLKLILPLDRELSASYRTVVVATDGGQPPKTGTMVVNIRILDNNDNSPKFDSDGYKVEVSESLAVGSIVLRVYAEDEDAGENGRVDYKLVDSSEAAHGDVFSMERETGSLVLKSPLDYESVKSYQLVVQAIDAGSIRLSSFVGVTVQVLDENDNAPAVTVTPLSGSGKFEVVENSDEPETGIAYLHASDPDEGKNGEVTCSILDVMAHDGKTSDDDDDDVDGDVDGDEDFSSREDCDDSGDSCIGSRRQRRRRPRDDLADPAVSLFRLEHFFNSDYKLETTRSLDREQSSRYKVAIECSDSGSQPSASVVTVDIRVVDRNDNEPKFDGEFVELKVAESAPVGTRLTRLNARDADEGENARISYSIEAMSQPVARPSLPSASGGETDESRDESILRYVRLDEKTGELFTGSEFDYETMPSRDLRYRVVATDNGHDSKRHTAWIPLTLTVVDSDDERPVFDRPSYRFSVSESSEPGQMVGKVTASDDDATKEFRLVAYALEKSFDSASFQIDSRSGVITMLTRLDRESKDAYHLVVAASNPLYSSSSSHNHLKHHGQSHPHPHRHHHQNHHQLPVPAVPPPTLANVTVAVLDSNDNPPIFIFPEKFRLSHVHVPLDAETGSHVTKAVATDIDQGENALVYYSIAGNDDGTDTADAAGLFAVDRNTGVVTNTAPLDVEKSYRLLFLAEDGGNPQLSATAELLVVVNGSLGGKGAALKADGRGSKGGRTNELGGEAEATEDQQEEGGIFGWFGLSDAGSNNKYYLPLLLATCCGAVGVLALVLAVAVVVLCRKKRLSERRLKRAVREKSDSVVSSRNMTGSPTVCELSCDESEKCRWPEGAEADDKWMTRSGGALVVAGSSTTANGDSSDAGGIVGASRKICCSSDRCLDHDHDIIRRSRSDRQRCPGVGGCDSDRSCGELCGSYVGAGGFTDCESCKESLNDVINDELFHLKAKSCCQVNQKLSKPDPSTSIRHQPAPYDYHHRHQQHLHHHHHRHLLHPQHRHHPPHPPSGQPRPPLRIPAQLPSIGAKQTHIQMVEQTGRKVKKKTPRIRVKNTQLTERGNEATDCLGPPKIDDNSESDMSGSFYCDSGLDSDRMHTVTRSS